MKNAIQLSTLIDSVSNEEHSELIQTVYDSLKSRNSRIIEVDKIQLGKLIRDIGEGYGSKETEFNWNFTITHNGNVVVLSTPINSKG